MDWIGLGREIINTYIAMAPYLLLGLTFAGILHITFTRAFVMRHLGTGNVRSTINAALLGVPLPLCSCGVLPMAVALRKNKASEGATMSFLISTPQTGVDSIVATWGMLGPVFAIFRPIAAFVMGIAGGLVVNVVGDGNKKSGEAESQSRACPMCMESGPHVHSLGEKLRGMARYAYSEFLDDISSHLIVGIIISGLISFFIPPDFFSRYVGNQFLEMLIMLIGGIPLYVCATASIPIAMALMMKGLSAGAAFVFLAAGPATNAAAIVLIAKAMGKRFLAVFLATISVFSVIAGFALNAVYTYVGSHMSHEHMMGHVHGGAPGTWAIIFSLLFLGMLGMSMYRKYIAAWLYGAISRRRNAAVVGQERSFVVKVNGMTCNRCVANLTESLYRVGGISQVQVDLANKQASIRGVCDMGAIRSAVVKAGFEVAD